MNAPYQTAEITLLDFRKPVSERTRKICGPYRWRPPAAPGDGVAFYCANKPWLAMDEAGSRIRLRLDYANEHLESYTRLGQITGYYCDNYQDETLKPIVAYLPRRRGFLAGWTYGTGCCAELAGRIWETIEEAARAAHSEAESAAELWREDSAKQAEDE